MVAIGWKPKGIARPHELLLINRADLERAGDTQDELLGPDLVRPRLGRKGSTLARAKEPGAWRLGSPKRTPKAKATPPLCWQPSGRLMRRDGGHDRYFVTSVGSRTPVNCSQAARNASWTGTSDAAA